MNLCGHYNGTFAVASVKASHCQSHLLPCRIRFAASVAAAVPISCCGARRGSGNRPAFTMSCCKAAIGRDVLVEENDVVSETERSYTYVMKFGGSSVTSAERMREVANLIISFPEERPVIVLSAMGKTTDLLLLAREKAVSCGVSNVDNIEELSTIKDLHLRIVDELGVDRNVIASELLSKLD
ncbi:hypothetical protein HN51_027889 [Arachis hypogaea]|uniref:Aspartate/glutamate/uridylate kinase domain-containing protein n=1 Tax=Arachis hypogaea TaxID=3818 RepID=A0A445BL11_ARAHY|nr:Aspartokinase 1 [Arachis hypogaea]RYR39359.1 hypothetical protein Ahy_A09g044865 [Arachis hypogaea]